MDPRKILGVSPNASLDEIHQAYREKVKKHHPDMGGDVWAFQQVNEAYESLTRPGRSTARATANKPNTSSMQANHSAKRDRERATHQSEAPDSTTRRRGAKRRFKVQAASQQDSGTRFNIFRHPLPLQTETSLFILVNVLDIFMTRIVLEVGGVEANPVAKYFLDLWGHYGLIWFKLAIVTFVCVIAQVIAINRLKTARGLLIVGTLLVFAVVAYGVSLIMQHVG